MPPSSRPQSNRRDFLRGESARAALEHWIEGVDAAGPRGSLSPHPETRTYLLQFERVAMACLFQIFLNAGDSPGGPEAALEGLDLIDALEDQLSIYRASSEISHFNREAQFGACHVEPRLYQLLMEARQIHAQTHGAFDMTAGPLSQAWGFSRRQGRVPTDEEIASTLSRCGTQHLQFGSADLTLRFGVPGMEINLGGIGKGYALDRVAEHLRAAEVENFLVQGGKSSLLAGGNRAGRAGWAVDIRHPQRPDKPLLEIVLQNQALGTSGTATQSFYHQGRRYGHILDPRVGRPVDSDLFSVTVWAPRAAHADALATAFFVLGAEGALAYCQAHTDVGALFVGPLHGGVRVELVGATHNVSIVRKYAALELEYRT